MDRELFDPPGIVQQAESVIDLVAAANAEHAAGRLAEMKGLEHYRKAGAMLLKAKKAAGHGNWGTVLKTSCKIPQQRASEYMRLAEGWDKLPPGGNFTLKEALAFLDGRPLLEPFLIGCNNAKNGTNWAFIAFDVFTSDVHPTLEAAATLIEYAQALDEFIAAGKVREVKIGEHDFDTLAKRIVDADNIASATRQRWPVGKFTFHFLMLHLE
jgi:hypothetical protein